VSRMLPSRHHAVWCQNAYARQSGFFSTKPDLGVAK